MVWVVITYYGTSELQFLSPRINAAKCKRGVLFFLFSFTFLRGLAFRITRVTVVVSFMTNLTSFCRQNRENWMLL